jgi:hypothetical protein
MVDVREDILARLLELVATLPNIRTAYRNNLRISEQDLPTAVVFDGDEETDDAADKTMRPSNKPTIVQLTPEIVVVDQRNLVGSALTTLRKDLIKLVLYDVELNEQIVKTGRHGNGTIRYLGCQTDVGWMRSLHGALKANFMFRYSLKPDDL